MQHTATHCNTWITKLKIILPWDSRLQHAATRCNALHTRTRCNTWIEKNPEDTILGNTLQHTAAHCNTMQHLDNVALEDICIGATRCGMLQHTATHCNTLQHTAMHCNIHIHTAAHCNTLQHTATHCNTLQHTAAHCSTLQHLDNKAPENIVLANAIEFEPIVFHKVNRVRTRNHQHHVHLEFIV